jgi:hypothetical protein
VPALTFCVSTNFALVNCLASRSFGNVSVVRLVPKAGREGLAADPGNISTYFGITGGRDHKDLVAHFHEAHVDQDPEVVRADWY